MDKIRHDWPKRWLHGLKASLDDADEDVLRNTDAIQRELSSPSRFENGVYSSRLRSIAVAYGKRGVVEVAADSGESGWHHIARSFQFLLAAFRVRSAMNYPNGGWHDTNQACLLFTTSLALQSRPVAEWLAELLITSEKNNSPLSDWQESPFQPFALHLARSVAGVENLSPKPTRQHPGMYDRLLSAQNIEDTQAAISEFAISRVCLVSPSYGELQPFEWSPFDLFPVDVLAAIMVYHDGIPRFDFGCLESHLCNPPIPFPHSRDGLVERVLARVSSSLPLPAIGWE